MATQGWDVGILGATGMVGQQLVRRLEGHPWFRLTWAAASERSEGLRYGDVPWLLGGSVPQYARDLRIERPVPGRAPQLLFSALDAESAGRYEHVFAAGGHFVVSNARTHRLDGDVPLLIPEVNADHLALVPAQQAARGWRGAVVTNPNCSTIFLALVLAACRPFVPRRVMVTTFQAASGAGHPGVASWDLLGNVVPFIDGEEEKLETETRKILGTCRAGGVAPAPCVISAQAARVPVLDGHTEAISIGFDHRRMKPTSSRRCARSTTCRGASRSRPRRPRPSSTCRNAIAHSRASTPTAPTAWRCASAACGAARCSTTSWSPSGTTPSAAPPARQS